jgi:hypothetical protein
MALPISPVTECAHAEANYLGEITELSADGEDKTIGSDQLVFDGRTSRGRA